MNRTGLILAGGASRRFGGQKPLALLDGRPLVRWVADALASRCEEICISIAAGDAGEGFQRAVPGARIVADERGDRGPIEGFAQGFRAANGDIVCVAPADAPLLQPSLYDALLDLLRDHDAAIPRHAAMDPIRGVYRRHAVLRSLSADLPSPSALVDRLDAVFLEGSALLAADPTRLSFVDVNRLEDLAAAHPLARVRR